MDPNQDKELTETQEAFDAEAALGEISSDLFGQGNEEDREEKLLEGEQEKDGADPSGTVSDPAPQTGQEEKSSGEGENTDEVQATGAPKTWTKEALAEWATISPRAQQEILKREEDFLRGIGQYKEAAEVGGRYSKVVEPYSQILAAENIDPVQLFQSFAANHYLLSRGSAEQKVELAAAMIHGYGIDLGALAAFIGDNPVTPADPKITALEKELAEVKSRFSAQDQQQQQVTQQQIDAEIEALANDPARPYFNEVVNDMAKLLETGVCKDLNSAYEHAVYANPVTRQKEIDRLTGEKLSAAETAEKARLDKVRKASAADLSVNPTSRNGTVPVGTIDDTLADTLASIQNRA